MSIAQVVSVMMERRKVTQCALYYIFFAGNETENVKSQICAASRRSRYEKCMKPVVYVCYILNTFYNHDIMALVNFIVCYFFLLSPEKVVRN